MAFSNGRQDPVADELVERHAALRAAPLIRMRDPNTASASPAEQRGDEVGERLGGVLPVAVEHDDDVQAVLDGQLVAGLLVAAVAQVAGLADQGDGQIGDLLVAEAHQVGGVLAVVVADDHLLDVRTDLGRDPVQHLGQRGRRVVGHHEDPDPLLLACSHRPALPVVVSSPDPSVGSNGPRWDDAGADDSPPRPGGASRRAPGRRAGRHRFPPRAGAAQGGAGPRRSNLVSREIGVRRDRLTYHRSVIFPMVTERTQG